MPKIIPDIRQKLLDTAELILRKEGYTALSIRRLAGECHVAVGTVYNYFREKNEIVANVMLQSWGAALADMDAAAAQGSFADGMQGIYQALVRFIGKHRDVWAQFSGQGGSSALITVHHRQLRGQIAERIVRLAQRQGDAALAAGAPLLAELVLAAALQEDIPPQQAQALFQRIGGLPNKCEPASLPEIDQKKENGS